MPPRHRPVVPVAATAPGKVSRWRIWLGAGVVLAAVAFTYVASFRGGWVYDDLPGIVENPTLRQASSAFFPPAASGSPVSGRPLLNASLALNYAFGGTDPRSYHAVNVLIHGICALLLLGLVRRTLALRSPPSSADATVWVGTAVALIWAVHPLGTEAVTYIVQRAESLMTLFFLLTLYAFVRGATSPASARWWWLSVVACAAGMGTKEVMVGAPLVVLLYDATFLSAGFVTAWKRHRRFYLGLAATWLWLAVLIWGNRGRGGTAGFDVKATWWSYAVAQLHAHLLYLKLAIWPHPLVFDYGVDRLPFSLSPWVLGALAVAAAVVILVALGRRTWAGFLAATYLLVLAPTSSVLPIVTEPIAEHRLYLPLACLGVAAVIVVRRLIGRQVVALVFAVAIPLALIAVQRQGVYTSERRLWADTVAQWPDNARAQYNLGQAMAEGGNFAGAVPHYEHALALRPDFASAQSNLANALIELGRIAEGAAHAREALRLNASLPEAHNNLGNALLLEGDASAAMAEYRTAVQFAPEKAEFHNNLGTALSQLGRLADALREYDAAVRLGGASPLFHFNRGNTCARLGRFAEAAAEYQATLKLNPEYPGARDHLARVRQLESGAAR